MYSFAAPRLEAEAAHLGLNLRRLHDFDRLGLQF